MCENFSVQFECALEYAYKREIDEMDEVGLTSKKRISSKKAISSQKKGENTNDVSHANTSSIKKQLEFMQWKPPRKASKKISKSIKEDIETTKPSGMNIHKIEYSFFKNIPMCCDLMLFCRL